MTDVQSKYRIEQTIRRTFLIFFAMEIIRIEIRCNNPFGFVQFT